MVFCAGEYEPLAPCTPVRPGSSTHSGKGSEAMVLPAAISSFIQFAIWLQPAACQVSKGPRSQPKPQRNAKSKSRALFAMLSRCTAQ